MILIVDDRPENIFSLKTILELNQFQVDTALSGEDALKKILKNTYALIILDVQMPGMDGFEVAETITGLNKTKDTPILFLSAVNTDKKFITKGFESGAVDYITKPVDPDILILKVRNFYRLYEKTHALKETQAALTSTINELHSTLESIPQIAFTAGPDGAIDFVNQHWYEYATDLNLFPEVHPGDVPVYEKWKEAVEACRPLEMEARIRELSTGQYRFHLLRAKPVRIEGKLIKWVGTFTDIQEQKSLNEVLERKVADRTRELLEINRELEMSNNDLQQFASVASHDLKEPLRKIQVFGSMIKSREKINETTASYIEKIMVASQRMTTLINDLLSFARLSESLVYQQVDVHQIIDDILVDLELSIQEKNAEIHVAGIPCIEAIPSLIRQLFQNIISNALKFSKPDQQPVIEITADLINIPVIDSPAVEHGDFCRIKVSDNGIGFDDRYAEKIFTLFRRLNSRESYEGTGIGLAIAKKIVDKHNGLIIAKSRINEGASFIIILPVRQNEEVRQSVEQLHSLNL